MLQPPGGATGTHGPGRTLSLSPPGGDGKGQLLTPRSFKLLLQSEGGIKGRSRSPACSSGEDAASSSTQAALETQTASLGSRLGAGSKFIRGCPAVRASSSSSLRKQDNVPRAARVAGPRTPLPLTRCTQLCSILPGSMAVASSSSAASEGTELRAPGKKSIILSASHDQPSQQAWGGRRQQGTLPLLGCPRRGFGHGSSSRVRARSSPNAAQSSSGSKFRAIFLLLTSFAVGQKRAARLRTRKPERSRGDRKSQTRAKFSLFWVKRGGGSGGAGRGKPFLQKSSPRGHACTKGC